jgi:putative transposase
VNAHQAEHSISVMCRVLAISRSGYYAWRTRAPSTRAKRDGVLRARVKAIHAASDGTYGSPRIRAELAAGAEKVSQKHVARLMREEDLRGVHRRRFVTTTVRAPADPVAPDLVERNFVAPAPNVLWVADITFVPTWGGFIYLAVVLDVFSRRIVGWAMSSSLNTDVVVAALDMAVTRRRPNHVIHHSDQGCQYTSTRFGEHCTQAGIRMSMGTVGDAYDNAMCESFFATLECELLDRYTFRNHEEARQAIFKFIEGFYNSRRRHSALGYLSPIDFERAHKQSAACESPPRPPLDPSSIGGGHPNRMPV